MKFKPRSLMMGMTLAVLVLITLSCGAAATQPPGGSHAEPTQAPAAYEATQPAPPEATSEPAPLPSPAAGIPEARFVVMEWPPAIRADESDNVSLSLVMDEGGNLTATAQVEGNEVRTEPVQIPNVYATHNVVAEAALEMAGVIVDPPDEILEPLQPGEPVIFIWSVKPDGVGTFRGTIWVHLRFIPKNGGPESRRVLTAQRIEIRSVNLLGLGGTPARWLGALGSLVGSFLGLDNVLQWLWKLVTRRRRARASDSRV